MMEFALLRALIPFGSIAKICHSDWRNCSRAAKLPINKKTFTGQAMLAVTQKKIKRGYDGS